MRNLFTSTGAAALVFLISAFAPTASAQTCQATGVTLNKLVFATYEAPFTRTTYSGCSTANRVKFRFFRSLDGAAFAPYNYNPERPILEPNNPAGDPWTLSGIGDRGRYYFEVDTLTSSSVTISTGSARSQIFTVGNDSGGGSTCTTTPAGNLPAPGTLTVGQSYPWNASGCAGLAYSFSLTGGTGATSGTFSGAGTVGGNFTPTAVGTLTATIAISGNTVLTRSYTVQAAPCTTTSTGTLPAVGTVLTQGQAYPWNGSGCPGVAYSLVVTGGAGATSGTLPDSGNVGGTFSPTALGSITVTLTVGGTTVSRSYSVQAAPCTITSTGALPAAGTLLTVGQAYSWNGSGCPGTAYSLAVTGGAGSTSGAIPDGGNVGGTFTPTAAGTLTVTLTVGGTSVSRSYSVQAAPCTTTSTGALPAAGTLLTVGQAYSWNGSGCPGTAYSLAVTGGSGSTSGAIPDGGNVGGTFTPTAAGTLTATLTVGATSVSRSYTVQAPPCSATPTGTLPGVGTVLTNGQSYSWSLSGCEGTSYSFAVGGGNGSVSGAIPAGGLVSGSFTPTAVGTLSAIITANGGTVLSRSYTVQATPCGIATSVNFPGNLTPGTQTFTVTGCSHKILRPLRHR